MTSQSVEEARQQFAECLTLQCHHGSTAVCADAFEAAIRTEVAAEQAAPPSLRALFDSYRRSGAWEDTMRGEKFTAWCAETEAAIIAAVRAEYHPPPIEARTIDIVFDGPPSNRSGRFVEVQSPPGTSIRFGEWLHREDGYWALRFEYDQQQGG